MKFEILTLIDITETGQHRGPDKLAVNQQANYNTVIQTIGLRINPNPIFVEVELMPIKGLGFGNSFKGNHNCWNFLFDVEYEEGLNLQMLEEDFHLVPVITDLNETININTSAFNTRDDKEKNIIFKCVY